MDEQFDRKAVRARLRQRRVSQDSLTALHASRLAQEHLLGTPLWQSARIVCLYAATQGEVGTDLLMCDARAFGRTMLLPRVRKSEPGIMDFVAVRGTEDLVPGSFGLLEPQASLPGIDADHCICDLAVIPGVAFALDGSRLGFGGGFYDRYFCKARAAARVGLCYSFQLTDRLPVQPWDVTVTHICTEHGLTRAGAEQSVQ